MCNRMGMAFSHLRKSLKIEVDMGPESIRVTVNINTITCNLVEKRLIGNPWGNHYIPKFYGAMIALNQ